MTGVNVDLENDSEELERLCGRMVMIPGLRSQIVSRIVCLVKPNPDARFFIT